MLARIKSISDRVEDYNQVRFLQVLRDYNLVNKKGEPREIIEIFKSGNFLNKETGEELEGVTRIPWIFSTFDLDRCEEQIDPDGWQLEHFKSNPVIQWAHNHQIPAIGFAKDTLVKDGKLGGEIYFNTKDIDPFGWSIGQRVLNGSLRAGSVGYLILQMEIHEPKDKDADIRIIHRKQELLEFSICNVPANPFALAPDQKEKIESKSKFKLEIFKRQEVL